MTVSSSTIKKTPEFSWASWLCGGEEAIVAACKHFKSWLEFARRHKNWTVQQWDTELWSDESAFQLFCGAQQATVRRRVDERYSLQCIVPTVKNGGGSLVV